MGLVLFVMGAVVSVVIALLVGGLMLPRTHSVAREIRLRATPETVWSLIADPAGYPAWRDTMSSVDMDGTAPLRWREYGDDGALAFEAMTVNAPNEFTARVIDDDVARKTERRFLLTPDGDGTRVHYQEQSSVTNPIARFVFRYIMRRTGAMDRTLVALAATLSERADPVDG